MSEEKQEKPTQVPKKEEKEEESIPPHPDYSSLLPCGIPRDDEGYVKAFPIYMGDDEKEEMKNKQEIQEFFDKYGVVVLKDLLTEKELENTREEIWDYMEETYSKFKKDDTSTWKNVSGWVLALPLLEIKVW